jgi:ACS family glucarate transporter-like MFS transporter
MADLNQTTPATRSHVRWFLVFWIFILAAIAFLDRVNISIAGGSIASAYGMSNIQLGSIFSALLWGYALFQTLGGRLADRIGPRRVLSAGVLWWGLFTALTAVVPPKTRMAILWLVSIRFLLGAGEAVMFPASNQFISRWIPLEERGLANGLIFAGVGAGAGLSPPLISYLMFHYGWRLSFWFCAALGLVAGSIWYVISRDRPEEHRAVSPTELASIHAGLTLTRDAGSPAGPGEVKLVPWKRVLTSKDVLAVTLSYFTFGYLAWIFFSWFYIYLAEARGLNLKASAFYAMLPALAMAVFCLVGGKISDALTRWRGPRLGRSLLASAAFVVAAAFVASGVLVANPGTASLVLAGGAGALYLAQSSFWSVTAGLAGHSSGSVSGFMNMGAQVGGAVTAQVTPWIAARFGWTAAFLVAAALALFGAAAWLFVNPETRLWEAETREATALAANRSALSPAERCTGPSRI